jgi:hypothetical protein
MRPETPIPFGGSGGNHDESDSEALQPPPHHQPRTARSHRCGLHGRQGRRRSLHFGSDLELTGGTSAVSIPKRKPYVRPRIVLRERLEGVAGSCVGGHSDATTCASGPINS